MNQNKKQGLPCFFVLISSLKKITMSGSRNFALSLQTIPRVASVNEAGALTALGRFSRPVINKVGFNFVGHKNGQLILIIFIIAKKRPKGDPFHYLV